MFLTKECDYAIRVVRGLADLEMKSVKTICDHEQIPRPFAYKILKKLEYAGIVSSYRGAGGGYQLARLPDSIVLFDIVSAIDGQLLLNECLRQEHICPRNPDENPCGVHKELVRVQELLVNALSEKTVDNII